MLNDTFSSEPVMEGTSPQTIKIVKSRKIKGDAVYNISVYEIKFMQGVSESLKY